MANRTPVGKATSPTVAQAQSSIARATSTNGFLASGPNGVPAGKLPSTSPKQNADAQSTTSSPSQSNIWTIDDQEQFRQQLLDSKTYEQNRLNKYLNPTYHIKFFVADIEAYRTSLGSTDSIDFKSTITAMDKTPKIIIAESGVTATLNIIDLVFNQAMIKLGEKNAQTLKDWKMTIREPQGTMFYDFLRNAIIKIGAKTYSDYPYFIEISFKGYNPDGSPNNNVLSDMSNGGRFLHRVQISDIETKFEVGGAVHQLTMQPVAYLGWDGESAHAQSMIGNLKASTVGEFFDLLEKELTHAQDLRYGTDANTGHYSEYKFIIKPFNGDDPRKWSIVNKEPDKNPSNMLSFDGGKPTFNIPPGTPIEDIINVVFSNTEQAQRYANSVPVQDETEESKDKTNSQRFKDANIMRCYPVVSETKFHPITQRYMRKYEYVIMMYNSQAAVNSATQVQDAKKPQTQRDMVKMLFDKGFLRKKYDYLYTGLNTEVLSLDMAVHLQWTAVLPNLLGYRLNGPMVSQHDKYNKILAASAAQAKVREAADDLARAQAELSQAQRDPNATTDQIKSAQKSVADARATFTQQNSLAQSDRQAVYKQQDANPRKNAVEADRVVFAETLTDTPNYDDVDVEVGITQAPAGMDMDVGKGMAGQYHRDRGLYGAMFDQIASAAGGSMQDIEMEIRGDPFWLSRGGVEVEAYKSSKLPQNDSKPDLAKYLEGDNSFLLYVSYPSGTDENGNPVFRKFDDGARKDVISSIYRVIEVVNKFESGAFTQTLRAQRIPLITLAGSLGFKQVQQDINGQLTDVPETPSGDIGGITGSSNSTARVSNAQKQHDMQVAYDALRSKGYTHEAAKTMVAEIGRENGFNRDNMFGTHTDANNGATNAGLISWQGSRRTALNTYMADRGLLNPDGTFVHSDQSIQAQIDFIDHELKTSPQYSRSLNAMQDPNLSYGTIEQVVGTNYIAWDRAGKKINPQRALDNQKTFYNTISDIADKNVAKDQ